jgi:T5SS/PEP-CTERM-associated repeat protein
VISNGGRVFNNWGHIGYDTNSFNNQALVTGAGSIWSNATVVLVGDSGSSNSLAIRDGGLVDDYWGIVGEGESGSNNSVYVESGGVWRSQQLAVGDMGSHNALFVDGGSVFVSTSMVVGYNPLYCNNLVQLESGQVIVTNAAGNATLEVYGGSFVLLGGTLRVDTLVVTNDCAQFMHLGGTLVYKTLMLDPNLSAVGDGILNGWKQHYGLDPFDPNLANEDPDGDGFTSLQKFLAGFNPTNAAAYPHIISVARQGANINVTYRGANGDNTWSPGTASLTNVLEFTTGTVNGGYSNNFVSANVTNILSGGTGTGIVTNMIDSGAATNSSSRYYRVRVLVP